MYRGHNLQDVETMITPTSVVLVGTHNPAGETAHPTTNETEADTDLVGFEAHRRLLHCPRSIDHHIEAARLKRNANRSLIGGGVSDHPGGKIADPPGHAARMWSSVS